VCLCGYRVVRKWWCQSAAMVWTTCLSQTHGTWHSSLPSAAGSGTSFHDLVGLLSSTAARISQHIPTLSLGQMTATCSLFIVIIVSVPCGPGAIPLPLNPPFTLSFSIFYFCFSISYSLHLFSCFSIPFHYTKIVPLCFQAGCHCLCHTMCKRFGTTKLGFSLLTFFLTYLLPFLRLAE